MALQTREQHIRREKATSNVCTAQVLLAVIAGMYAVWHGPDGLTRIAKRVHKLAASLAAGLERAGHKVRHDVFFDTICVEPNGKSAADVLAAARDRSINLRADGTAVCIALDETATVADVTEVLAAFGVANPNVDEIAVETDDRFDERFARTSTFLTHPIFHQHHSETEMLRYMRTLESRDFSLVHGMIPLGSCTMKLNATAEMIPVTWPEIGKLHPFAPPEQAVGYAQMFKQLESDLADITGFDGVSLQPNAGSQGELAGLLVIRRYHESRGQGHRNVCLIPQSAHGTNPASAVMAGLGVVVVKTDPNGNIDVADLKAKAEEHKADLAALMVTYPSTHGVFEETITDICAIVHANGGQVYMDGANMNALVGVARRPTLARTSATSTCTRRSAFRTAAAGLAWARSASRSISTPFLPGHPVIHLDGHDSLGAVSAAPWGSASILPISWVYIRMMGGSGLTDATKIAILNANYIAKRLEEHFPVLYKGKGGLVAHECIVDPRGVKQASGVEVEDIAKRLMDYGFHAPTVSFPVAGTLMIEPTESESKIELDRFCDAMIAIRDEIRDIESGVLDKKDNPLKNSPHTMDAVISDNWSHAYSRERAAFPLPSTRERKFWPAVGRVESAYGDRNLVCACPPIEEYA